MRRGLLTAGLALGAVAAAAHAARCTDPRAGVYTAAGAGNHLKLTVTPHSVEVTTGTTFRITCAGPVTADFTGHSPDIRSVAFHPGFHPFALDADGAFTIRVLSNRLEGRVVGPSEIAGRFVSGASTECVGTHRWTASPSGGTIAPAAIPVLPRTYGYFLVQKSLLPPGWTAHPTVPVSASAGGKTASWDIAKGQWREDGGGPISKRVSPDGRWLPGSRLYKAMVREALPSGARLTGPEQATGGATWDEQLQVWRRNGAAVSRGGLTILEATSTNPSDVLEYKADGSGANATGTAWNVCIYLRGAAGRMGSVTVEPATKPFTLDARGHAEVVFTVSDDGVKTFVIRHKLANGKTDVEGSSIAPYPTLATPPWGLPACTPP